MALEVYWSIQADKRFDAILLYLEKEWGEKSVTAFVKEVYELIGILSQFPEIGIVEYPKANIRAIVIVKQVSLFYQVRANKIIILNFFDNRQKQKKKRF